MADEQLPDERTTDEHRPDERARAHAAAAAGSGYNLVVVANRLPVDGHEEPGGEVTWRPSPGGLVAALEPVMRRYDGAWVGWTGVAGSAPPPFDVNGLRLVAVGLEQDEVEGYYEGMSNATLWPLYHDVIAPPRFHRAWWEAYVGVNRRFALATAEQVAPGGTVWVQDYQLQLVPMMLRQLRPDVRIGFFNHIPFPPYEIFAQLPWRRQVLHGLLGSDLVGFQRPADANNFLRACRRNGLPSRAGVIRVGTSGEAATADSARSDPARASEGSRPGGTPADGMRGVREVRAGAFPISVDARSLDDLSRRPDVVERARQIRHDLGDPPVVLLGVDRLDYTKGILHRLEAVGELFDEGRLATPDAVVVIVATPSRERVETYQHMRDEVEVAVGRINGLHGQLGHPAVHYLHQSYPREELAALYLAADVMLVTSLRDGMNLVAKEYVATRHDERGALVLSEFTGAALELPQALLVNPHDIDGLKDVIVRAASMPSREATRRMRAMRRRVFEYDVARWARDFLVALGTTDAVTAAPVVNVAALEAPARMPARHRAGPGGDPALVSDAARRVPTGRLR